MPSVSDKQRRYLEWHFGHEWVKAHHFDHVAGKAKAKPKTKPHTTRTVKRRKRGG